MGLRNRLLRGDTAQRLRVKVSRGRRRVTLEQLGAQGCRHERVFDETRPDWDAVQYVDGTSVDFMVDLPATLPAAGLVKIPNGRVLSDHGWPLTQVGEIVIDSVFAHEKKTLRYFDIARREPRFELVTGRTLNLTSAWCGINYGHALKDSLGRLAIVQAADISLDSFDTIVIPAFRSETLDAVLASAGAAPEQLRRAEPDLAIESDELTVTSFPGVPRCYPGWVAGFFRGLVAPTRRDRRLWLPRPSGTRADLNNDAATEIAREYGFETYSPGPTENALQALAEAEIVAGPHGAALANIVACAPGTKIIEVLPSGHRYPHFASVALTSGMPYLAVHGQSVSDAAGADFHTDLDELRAALEQATT